MRTNILGCVFIVLFLISCSSTNNKLHTNVYNFYKNLPDGFGLEYEAIIDSVIDKENGYLYFNARNEYGDCNYTLKIFDDENNKTIFGITQDYPLRECRYYAWVFMEYCNENYDDAFKKIFDGYYEYPDSVLLEMGRAYPLLSAKLFYDDEETLQMLKDYVNYYAADKSVPYDFIFKLPRFGNTIEVTLTICDNEFEENISTREQFEEINSNVNTIKFKWNNETKKFDLEN